MIPTSQLASTGRTAPSDTGCVINMDIYLASNRVQRDIGNKPWIAQPQNPRIQVRVLHGHPPGLTITGHLPTENPEGPESYPQGADEIPDKRLRAKREANYCASAGNVSCGTIPITIRT
jgi:hypothetical protein